VSGFHQSKQWAARSRKHKAIAKDKGKWRCVGCGYKGELESDHILPVSKYPMMGLWLCNLALRCGPCNKKKGAKFYVSPRALLLFYFYSMIVLAKSVINACLIVFLSLIFLIDLTSQEIQLSATYKASVIMKEAYISLLNSPSL